MDSLTLLFIRKCPVFLVLILRLMFPVKVAMVSIFGCLSWYRQESSAISSAYSRSSTSYSSHVHLIPLLPLLVARFNIQSIPSINRKMERLHPVWRQWLRWQCLSALRYRSPGTLSHFKACWLLSPAVMRFDSASKSSTRNLGGCCKIPSRN